MRGGRARIEFLSDMRNKALQPLFEQNATTYDKVLVRYNSMPNTSLICGSEIVVMRSTHQAVEDLYFVNCKLFNFIFVELLWIMALWPVVMKFAILGTSFAKCLIEG